MIDRVAAVAQRPVSRETFEQLNTYIELLTTEARAQNLISASTLAAAWDRHIIDSAQLVRFEPTPGASWADIGSGAGLPGLVVAILVQGPVTLIEPRRLRAEFLAQVVSVLALDLRVKVIHSKVEHLQGTFDTITARAVAPLSKLLTISQHLSTGKSRWVLPKGRSAESELAEARRSWQGVFHVERSVTDEDSQIIVATGVRAKRK